MLCIFRKWVYPLFTLNFIQSSFYLILLVLSSHFSFPFVSVFLNFSFTWCNLYFKNGWKRKRKKKKAHLKEKGITSNSCPIREFTKLYSLCLPPQTLSPLQSFKNTCLSSVYLPHSQQQQAETVMSASKSWRGFFLFGLFLWCPYRLKQPLETRLKSQYAFPFGAGALKDKREHGKFKKVTPTCHLTTFSHDDILHCRTLQ